MMIRLMKEEDFSAARKLWADTPFVGAGEDDTFEGFRRFLTRNPTTCFAAADEEGKLIGTILAGHDGRRGQIYHACVAVLFRRQGIGEKLVQAALTALREENIGKVNLHVFTDNTVGQNFWKKQGFEQRKDLIPYAKLI